MLPCERCAKAGEACLRKARGLGCHQCVERKLGCSLVGMWKVRVEKKKLQGVEITSNNAPAPLVELSDGFMEQMVRLTGEVRKTRQGIWAIVRGVWRLVRLVERWMERDERVSELEEEKGEEKEEEKKSSKSGMEEELEKIDRGNEEGEGMNKNKDEEEKENGEMEEGEEKGGDGDN